MEDLTKKELIELAEEKGVKVKMSMTKAKIIQTIKDGIKYKGLPAGYLELRKEITDDLLDQLERNGTYGEFYVDLVKDYMALWDIKNRLILDVDERGVSVPYQNGPNQWGARKNDSVAELQRTNNQMLRLLDHLGLKPSNQESGEYDPSDLEM